MRDSVGGHHSLLNRSPQESSAPATANVAGKSTRHVYTHLRSGAVRTSNGWNVKDFAASIMNPNAEGISVVLKMISDDPKFVFRDGSVGIWAHTYEIPPLSSVTYNPYGPLTTALQIPTVIVCPVRALTNFTGSAEFSSSLPFYVYSGHEFETGEVTSADPDRAWLDAWNPWKNDVPAVWDSDLQQFVIPYTNYWHNMAEYPVGWHSTLSIKNNTDQRVTYLIWHKPAGGAHKDPTSNCQATDYPEQTSQIVLDKGQELITTLEGLYGWPAGQASFLEGFLLIRPSPITSAKGTIVKSSVVPNSFGTGMCSAADGLIFVTLTSPVAKVQGTVNVTGSTFNLPGFPIEKVDFYVDGKLAATATRSPYGFSWNTVAVSNGSHTLTAVAFGPRSVSEIAVCQRRINNLQTVKSL
jgi:hypothetical protein